MATDPRVLVPKNDPSKYDTDVFDPIAWYEWTGEDVGLPPGHIEKVTKAAEEWLAAHPITKMTVDGKPVT